MTVTMITTTAMTAITRMITITIMITVTMTTSITTDGWIRMTKTIPKMKHHHYHC